MERARRLGLTSEVDRLAAGEDREVAGTRLLEMVIGRSNFLGARFLSDGARAARSVGRIALEIGAERRLGTGVLVAPRLVMTNHHVIANEEEAVSGRVQFNYVEQRDGSIGTVSEYALRGDEFFVTDEELDFSIVAIEEMSTGGIPASSWGWHPLFGQTGKAIVGERVNILQHPDGRPQEVAIHENLVVDVFDSWVHYTTDTQAGSSGAPVFNNNWELAALHHAAVSLDDAAGGDDGGGSGDGPHLLNEGVRISSIVARLTELFSEEASTSGQGQFRSDLLNPAPVPAVATPLQEDGSTEPVEWEIPLTLRLSVRR